MKLFSRPYGTFQRSMLTQDFRPGLSSAKFSRPCGTRFRDGRFSPRHFSPLSMTGGLERSLARKIEALCFPRLVEQPKQASFFCQCLYAGKKSLQADVFLFAFMG